ARGGGGAGGGRGAGGWGRGALGRGASARVPAAATKFSRSHTRGVHACSRTPAPRAMSRGTRVSFRVGTEVGRAQGGWTARTIGIGGRERRAARVSSRVQGDDMILRRSVLSTVRRAWSPMVGTPPRGLA